MDPNQDNQNGGDTGDNRQAIFTPQPEQPEVVPNASAPAQPSTILSHPYFSNHPTQTFNNDTGDIILNTGGQKPKQNKRPFIIGGIILAIFAVICVVILVVVSQLSGGKETKFGNAEVAFNQYATYFLYGTANDNLSGEYQPDKTYEVDLQLESEEVNKTYWNKSSELLNDAIKFAESDEKITRYLVSSLQSYKQYFDFISLYRQKGEIDEGRLLAVYLSDGADAARSNIDDFYNNFGEQNFDVEKNYIENRKQQYYNMLEVYEIYNTLGCIHDGEIDDNNCARAASENTLERLEVQLSLTSGAKSTADRIIKNSITYLKSRCWDLSTWLQNPVDERDTGGIDEE